NSYDLVTKHLGPGGGTNQLERKTTIQNGTEPKNKARSDFCQKQQQSQQTTKVSLRLAPLIYQGVKMTRYVLNNFIKTKMPDVKLIDIQSNRNGTLTIFDSDVYSYNKILLDLPKHKFDNANNVKNVDVEISIQEIEAALKSSGFDIDTAERLKNHKKDGDGIT
ncbi:unnamed protein product, partial [Didymodactylos carnosus]